MPKRFSLAKPASSMTIVTLEVPTVCHWASLPSFRQLLVTLGAEGPSSEPNTCWSVGSEPTGPTLQRAPASEAMHRLAMTGRARHTIAECRIGFPSGFGTLSGSVHFYASPARREKKPSAPRLESINQTAAGNGTGVGIF